MAYIGKQPTVGNFVKLDSIVTSATTTFNLLNGGVAYYPQSANHCLVSLNGILQAPTDSFTISGSTIIFSSALTTSDVIDFIIVLGDVLNIGTPSDATVTFPKVTSNLITGATAETSIDGADSILIYDDSATALRKMTRTNFVSGLGGLSEADAWRISSSITFTGAGISDVTANWERVDTDGFDKIGTGLTQSSGIFTFPSTGYYYINLFGGFLPTASRTFVGFSLWVTLNNSSYSYATDTYSNTNGSSYASTTANFIIKVTDTANIKFKFRCDRSDTTDLLGGTDYSFTGFSCIKLAGV